MKTKSSRAKKATTGKAPAGLSGSIEVLWTERKRPSRGPKPSLSPNEIALAAIAVADADGLAAVSMQRIALEVRVTTMALYRYFSSKQELIDLMIDNVAGPPPETDTVLNGWRSTLEEWTRRCWSVYRDHPWFLQATARQRIMGPKELKWLETALEILAAASLPSRQQHDAFLVLIGHVRSSAEFAAMTAHSGPADGWARVTAKLLTKQRDEYPALMAAIDSGAFDQKREDGLEFGLACILDGIEVLVAKDVRRG